jgi:hypothetical protein
MKPIQSMLLTGVLLCTAIATHAADYRTTALGLDPVVYFGLDDATLGQPAINLANGASSAGAGGNADYDLVGPELGQPTLVPGGNGTSVRFGDNALRTPLAINSAGSTGYTIAFWVRAPSNPSGPINLVGDGESALDFYAMVYLLADGTVRTHAKVASGFISVDTAVPVTDGNPHHVVARFAQPPLGADGLLEVFIDGAVRASLITTRNNLTSYLARLSIGRDLREPGSALVTLDEVAAWNRSLSSVELDLLTGAVFEDGFE